MNNNNRFNDMNNDNNSSHKMNYMDPFPELSNGNINNGFNNDVNNFYNNDNNMNLMKHPNPTDQFNNQKNNDSFNINQSNENSIDIETKLEKFDNTINEVMSINDNKNQNQKQNEEIKIYFNFVNGPTLEVKAESNKTIRNIYSNLKKEVMKKDELVAIHNCNLVNIDKSLLENNIKNNDYILFFQQKEGGNENAPLDEHEIEQLKKWLEEYKANKLDRYYSIIKNIKDAKNIPPFTLFNENEFIAFVLSKEREVGIKVREHRHTLVYSLTKFNWTCNNCKKNYNKNEGKYYCSLCDYSFCDKCRAKGYYNQKRSFPTNIPPCNVKFSDKFLKTQYHEHNLSLCRTSRIVLGRTYWNCNVCKKGYDDDIWSFYCTKCDYDLCNNCAQIL